MREESFERDPGGDWVAVSLQGGAATVRVPAGWQPASRDDGGLAFQSPGPRPLDLLLSLSTERQAPAPLPHGLPCPNRDGRRWIAYSVGDAPDDRVYVWKVTELWPDLPARVVTVQLHVPAGPSDDQLDHLLDGLVERLGEETARLEFAPVPGAAALPSPGAAMSEVDHGGLVRFRLPGDWICDREDDLSEFFPEGEGSGTLKVVAYSFPHRDTGADGLAEAHRTLQRTARSFADGPDGRPGVGSLDNLSEGEVVARFAAAALDEDGGGPVRQHLWLRGTVGTERTTLALFSFIHPEEVDGAAMVAMLDREIRAAAIGPDQLGSLPPDAPTEGGWGLFGPDEFDPDEEDYLLAAEDLMDLAEELGLDLDEDEEDGGQTSH
ncbi:MAG TPA: hypothetical protein VED40_08335 [Azospirillaceae bacterium]|nr:hypothetical protein [Azospirillaceae bacterium]